jgi:hypothetical protein
MKSFKLLSMLAAGFICVLLSTRVSAYDQPIAYGIGGTIVTIIEPSYLPDSIWFQINAPVANCAVGEWLSYDGGSAHPPGTDEAKRQSAVKAAYAGLLTALVAGRKVDIYAANKVQAGVCRVEFMHIL